MACLTAGAVVYPYANEAGSNAFALWCVGKSPDINWYDANNSDLKIQMDDRRVSQYGNEHCIDCNSEEFAAGSCAFAADYFPDHARTTTANNDFMVDMIIKCPFLSNSRSQSRYLDTV